jgi:hypothetical protein
MADKRCFALSCILFCVFAIESKAELLSAHFGTTDPLTENFTTLNTGPGTVGPVANVQGHPAWEMTSNALYAQVEYIDRRMLSASQLGEIASTGFTETLVTRVARNGNLAPAWTPSAPTIVGGTSTGVENAVGGPRFDIDLAINSQGNTVVVLPTAYRFGPGNVVFATGGLTDTLTDSAYHTYQLYWNPRTSLADLYIDGKLALSGYTGETAYPGFQRLYWGAESGGQEFANQVSLATGNQILSSVPEPSSLLLAATGSLALLGLALIKSRQRTGPQA